MECAENFDEQDNLKALEEIRNTLRSLNAVLGAIVPNGSKEGKMAKVNIGSAATSVDWLIYEIDPKQCEVLPSGETKQDFHKR